MNVKLMALGLLVPVFAWAQTVEVRADRDSHVYRCGEPTTFTVRVVDKDNQPLTAGQLSVVLSNFGTQQVAYAAFDLAKANPVTCTGTLHEPGFLKCTAVVKLDKAQVRGVSGAAYEPEKIVAGSPRPADFDAYWDAAIARLEAEVPLDPRVERFDRYCSDKHEAFKVSFATFDGLRVYGFLSVPKGPGPFPVEVNVPGAGPGTTGPNVGMADRGFIHLVMNVHPFEPAADAEGQKKLYAEQDRQVQERYGVKRYCLAGAAQRETYFYYRIMLGINRAVNWVAARPDVDKTHFAYTGSSQGGGFGFYLLGLNRHFTKGVIHVPAITDLLGFQKGRDSGWPKLIENMRESDKAAAIKAAPYFDGAHFAPRITCPVRVSVGFIDETCPPAAVYAGYNALRVADKEIGHGIGMPHRVFPEFYNRFDQQWLRQR
ncbi:MAG: acetylxylan esterase [Kiritimatiellae bacterium]|jgi:cephalosporin-C deacetylase|nr:acetylxylan esterase [Kiritimatiellia bacterium]HHU14998.1 acetylxylan esterase [Lentisphaerota bacterium]HON48945.1 acetylxylan esterase [Kiritimatiellia bacterium]